MISEEKQKALEAALGNIEKQFGKGSVMKLEIPVPICRWRQFPQDA